MTQDACVYAICCRTEVDDDVISGQNINRTVEGYTVVNSKVASYSSLRDFPKRLLFRPPKPWLQIWWPSNSHPMSKRKDAPLSALVKLDIFFAWRIFCMKSTHQRRLFFTLWLWNHPFRSSKVIMDKTYLGILSVVNSSNNMHLSKPQCTQITRQQHHTTLAPIST